MGIYYEEGNLISSDCFNSRRRIKKLPNYYNLKDVANYYSCKYLIEISDENNLADKLKELSNKNN